MTCFRDSRTLVIGFLLLLSMCPCTAQTSEPVVRFSVYAVPQKDSPVYIKDIKYAFHEMKIVVVNRTEKAITGVDVIARITPPAGCVVGEATTGKLGSDGLRRLRLQPREEQSVEDSISPLDVPGLVLVLQMHKISGAQVQVGVEAVRFADGNEWRPDPDPRIPNGKPTEPFIHSLVDTDANLCSSPTEALEAWGRIKGTGASKETKPSESATATVEGESLPHVTFECLLKETHAMCPTR